MFTKPIFTLSQTNTSPGWIFKYLPRSSLIFVHQSDVNYTTKTNFRKEQIERSKLKKSGSTL
jgi:hypothetical protein